MNKPNVIDMTPTWGEIALLVYRLAMSKEVAALNGMRVELAKMGAFSQAAMAIMPTLSAEQKAQFFAVAHAELAKQGVNESDVAPKRASAPEDNGTRPEAA